MKIEKINNKFRSFAEKVIKYRWITIIAFAILLIVSFMGTKKIIIKTSFDDYFVEGDPMLLKTNEFKSIFGNDYYVAVLVKNDNLFTSKNLELIRELSNELLDSLSYAEKITSLTDIEFMVGSEEGVAIEQIVPDVIPVDTKSLLEIKDKAFSKPNIAKKLVSKDGTMSWIMVKLRPFPPETEWKKYSTIGPDMLTGKETESIINKSKYRAITPNAAGMPFMNYEKVQYLKGEMGRLMLIACISAIIIMILITRSLRDVIAPLFITVSGIIIAFGIIGWSNLFIDMSTATIALILAFAVSVAYNIHLYNYFKTRFLQTGNRKESAIDTLSETGWPILFSALTTLAAMLSFLAMEIVPMRAMGINSALCLLSVLLTSIFITPIIYSFGKNTIIKKEYKKSIEGKLSNKFASLGSWVLVKWKPILIIAGLVTIIGSIGLFKIEPAFDVERSMGWKVPYASRFLQLCKTELGSMYSYDLMIVLPNVGDAKNPENLNKLNQIAELAEKYKLTKRHNSILDIIKDLNCTLNNNNPQYYSIPNSADMVAQLLLLYENAGGTESEYWMDYDYKRLRLQIEIGVYNSNEAESEMMDIQEKARTIFPNAKVSVVGNLPQFTVMQQYIVKGQMWSLLLSVIIVGIILMLAFGNWKLGLIGMIPNIAPAILVGGLMGWFNYPLDMMTATLIPMILGIAVDDTIHFINHGHLEYERQSNYNLAVIKTFSIVGTAIIMSTIIISTTFAGFTFSDAIQNRNFGILAISGMLSALLADLFITPILFKYLNVFGIEKQLNKN